MSVPLPPSPSAGAVRRFAPADVALLLVVMALAAGARFTPSPPVAGGGAVGAAILAAAGRRMRRRRASALIGLVAAVAAAACLGSVLAQRSVRGLHPPATGPVSGAVVTVAADPAPGPFGTRLTVRWRGKRLAATAAPALGSLSGVGVGDRLSVDLRIRAAIGDAQPWRRARHLAGDAEIVAVRAHRPATGFWGAAAAIRAHYGRAFASIPSRLRPLAGGFVLGDDRGQRPEVAADFRGSGLGHLLVVSGQNVAFVLAAARPMIDRLRLRRRVVGVALVLAVFGCVTRWEPSVVRAVAMAGAAAAARSAGRPQQALRVIGLGAGAVLVIDPMLVWSLGFCLSMAATLGLALAAEPIDGRLRERGVPGVVAAPLAATLAAQLLTVWLVLPLSGDVPLASLPANLVAVPLAGPTMVLGLVLGAVSGFLRPGVADVVMTPVELMLGATAGVARVAAGWPLGRLGAVALAVVSVAGTVLVASRPTVGRPARLLAGLAVAAALASGPIRAGWSAPVDAMALDGGGRLWQGGMSGFSRPPAVLMVGGRADGTALLAALSARAVAVIDVVVIERPTRAALSALRAVMSRVEVRVVVAGTQVLASRADGPVPLALACGDRVLAGPWVIAAHDTGARLAWRVDRHPDGGRHDR